MSRRLLVVAVGVGLVSAGLVLVLSRQQSGSGLVLAPGWGKRTDEAVRALADTALASDDKAEQDSASRRLLEMNAPALRRIKNLRVEVIPYFPANMPVCLEFPATSKRLFELAGVTVVSSTRRPADAILRLVVGGEAISAQYSTRKLTVERHTVARYTGAGLRGVVLVEADGQLVYATRFYSGVPRTEKLYGDEGSEPRHAPFQLALEIGLFGPFELLQSVSGPQGLLVVLERGLLKVPGGARRGWRQGDARVLAAEALGKLRDPRAVQPLITALGDKDHAGFRRAAAEALGNLKDPRAVAPLIAAFQDLEPDVRRAAAGALGRFDDTRVTEQLTRALHDGDANVRRTAAEALSRRNDPKAAKALIDSLRDAFTREAAARALGELKDVSAVPPLVEVLKQGSPYRQASVLSSLFQPPDMETSAAAADVAVAEALCTLADPRGLDAVIGALADSSVPPQVARFLPNAGARQRALRLLIAALTATHTSGKRRAAAAFALGYLMQEGAVRPLISALGDSDFEVRSAAARALGELSDPRAIEPLIGALNDPYSREAAQYALGKFRGPRAVQSLVVALRHSDVVVRSAAAVALGEIRDSRSCDPLIAALKDDSDSVRDAAADALRKLRDQRAAEPLLSVLTAHHSLEAAKALAELGDLRATEPLESYLRQQYADTALIALIRLKLRAWYGTQR